MENDVRSDVDGGVLRGAIVIVLAGIVIGVLYNGLLQASDGERGLAWIRRQVKLDSLEEMLADSTLIAAPESLAMAAPDSEPGRPMTTEAEPKPKPEPVVAGPVEDAPVGNPTPPPLEKPAAPRADSAVARKPGTPPDSQHEPGIPAIPDSEDPLLAKHATIKILHDRGAAIFVDARSAEEFEAGHISGAVNLPFDAVYEDPALLERLDGGERPIVCYCDGGECELAENLAFALIDAGYRKVLVYEGGTGAWTEAGEPLVVGPEEAPR